MGRWGLMIDFEEERIRMERLKKYVSKIEFVDLLRILIKIATARSKILICENSPTPLSPHPFTANAVLSHSLVCESLSRP